MTSLRLIRFGVGLALAALLLTACDDGAVDLATTTTAGLAGSTTAAPSTTAASPASTSTTRVAIGSSIDSYEIVARESGTDGEVLYIVIPQAAYTDVDLENFIGNLVETGTATWGVEVFDDVTAVEAYQKDESTRTDAENELIDQHHFVSLVEGDTIRFQGPFASSGEFVIGS